MNTSEIIQNILTTYAPGDLKVAAIKYYREATGVGLAEAKFDVERILLQTDRIGDKQSRVEKNNTSTSAEKRLKARTVIYLMIGLGLLTAVLVLNQYMKKRIIELFDENVNVVSESKREELLKVGYKEVKTNGKYVERVFSYNADGHLFIFEPIDEMDGYFSIVSPKDEFKVGVNCSGFHMFYFGELDADLVEEQGNVYKTWIADIDDIKIYDLTGEKFEDAKRDKEKEMSVALISLAVPGVLFSLLGIICLSSGKKRE